MAAGGVAADAVVEAVCASPGHTMSKPVRDAVVLVAGLGIDGDVHQRAGSPRQVHLLAAELLDELGAEGFPLGPGQVGENLTTRGLALHALGEGTRLHLGPDAVVELTGLRTPCRQLDAVHAGLRDAMRTPSGPRAGVMSTVVAGGTVRPGDAIGVEPADPPGPPLRPI